MNEGRVGAPAEAAQHEIGARGGQLLGEVRRQVAVVFALLALEEIGERPARSAIAVISLTVLLSVVMHGVTADPLARRYGPSMPQDLGASDSPGITPLPERRLIRRTS
jgi:hypothetical protein